METPVASKIISLDVSKAGLDGIDKDYVERIIEEATKGSKFYESEKRKQEQRQERVAAMVKKWNAIQSCVSSLSKATSDAEIYARSVARKFCISDSAWGPTHTSCSCCSKVYLHVDMDMYFAAVAMRDRPELRDVPMAVGGMSMICTSNYEARKYGVRAGMPGFIAVKLCPKLVFVWLDFDKYRVETNKIRTVLQQFDPEYVSMGLDEATLCISHLLPSETRHFGCRKVNESKLAEIAESLRAQIKEITGGLTASVGIASSAMLAKVAGNVKKPDAFTILPVEDQRQTLDNLPVRKITGVGKVTELILKAFNCELVKDLWDRRVEICSVFHPASKEFLMWIYFGGPSTAAAGTAGEEHAVPFFGTRNEEGSLLTDARQKSISNETTFHGCNTEEDYFGILLGQAEEAVNRMVEAKLECKTITIKVKLVTFEVKQFSQCVPAYSSDKSLIISVLRQLSQSAGITALHPQLRLIGVRLSGLRPIGKVGKQISLHRYLVSSKQHHKDGGRELKRERSPLRVDGSDSSSSHDGDEDCICLEDLTESSVGRNIIVEMSQRECVPVEGKISPQQTSKQPILDNNSHAMHKSSEVVALELSRVKTPRQQKKLQQTKQKSLRNDRDHNHGTNRPVLSAGMMDRFRLKKLLSADKFGCGADDDGDECDATQQPTQCFPAALSMNVRESRKTNRGEAHICPSDVVVISSSGSSNSNNSSGNGMVISLLSRSSSNHPLSASFPNAIHHQQQEPQGDLGSSACNAAILAYVNNDTSELFDGNSTEGEDDHGDEETDPVGQSF